MKVVNDLLNYNGMKIVQNTDWFSFSLDSVLLPNFVTLNKNIKTILDIGTGNAPIPLILSTKTDADIYGIEIQKEVYEMAEESLKINNLEDRIKLINDDVLNLDKYFDINSIDVITCNPPFFKINEGSKLNDNDIKLVARHEVKLDLDSLSKIVSKYLKNNGVFAMVHRTDRIVEIISTLKKYNLEPKKIQFVYPYENKESNIVLIEARKNGNSGGVKVLSPVFAHKENKDYTDEVKKMFE